MKSLTIYDIMINLLILLFIFFIVTGCAHTTIKSVKDDNEPTEQENIEEWTNCLESGQPAEWCVEKTN